jgi:hypothetical protein
MEAESIDQEYSSPFIYDRENNPFFKFEQLLSEIRSGATQPSSIALQRLYADLHSMSSVSPEDGPYRTSFEDICSQAESNKKYGDYSENIRDDRVVAKEALDTNLTEGELKSILSVGSYVQECLGKGISIEEVQEKYLDPIAAQFAISQKEHQAYQAMVPPDKKFLEAIKEIGGYRPVLELRVYGKKAYASEFFDGPNAEQDRDKRAAELEAIGLRVDQRINDSEDSEYTSWKAFPKEAQNAQNVLAINAAAIEIASLGEIVMHGDKKLIGPQYDYLLSEDGQARIWSKGNDVLFSCRGGFFHDTPPNAIADLLELPQKVDSFRTQIQLSEVEVNKSIDWLVGRLADGDPTENMVEQNGYIIARQGEDRGVFRADDKVAVFKDGLLTPEARAQDSAYVAKLPQLAAQVNLASNVLQAQSAVQSSASSMRR